MPINFSPRYTRCTPSACCLVFILKLRAAFIHGEKMRIRNTFQIFRVSAILLGFVISAVTHIPGSKFSSSIPNNKIEPRKSATIFAKQDTSMTFLGKWAWGPCAAAEKNSGYVYIGNGGLFQVLDLTNAELPIVIGEYLTQGLVWDVVVSGTLAYVATGSDLEIIDISVPRNPVLIGACTSVGAPFFSLAVSGNFAYVGDMSHYLHVIDISNPSAPVWVAWTVGSYEDMITDVEVYGNYAYVVGGSRDRINIIDVSVPAEPRYQGFYQPTGYVSALAITGNYLFVGLWSDPQFQIFDISNPTEPVLLGSTNVTSEGFPADIHIDDDRAYLGIGGFEIKGFSLIDISSIADPGELSYTSISAGHSIQAITYNNGYAYLSAYSGLCIIDASNSKQPLEKGFFPTGDSASRLRVVNNYAYLADGTAGLWIINMTNPQIPQSTGNIPVEGSAEDVDVEGNYAYLLESPITTQDSGCVRVVDISNPLHPVVKGSLAGILPWSSPVSSLDCSGNFLYVTIPPDSGVLIVDVSNPEFPQVVSSRKTGGGLYDIYISGEYAFLANDELGLRIFDISSPPSMIEVGHYAMPHANDVIVMNDLALVADTRQLFILNIADPTNPQELGSYPLDQIGRDWELSISDNIVYVAGGYQVQVIDFSIPSDPDLIGYIDSRLAVRGVSSRDDLIFVSISEFGLSIYQNELLTNIKSKGPGSPSESSMILEQNFPNPFNPQTQMSYQIPTDGLVKLEVFNIRGQKVATLINGHRNKGKYQFTFQNQDLSSGVYFYRLETSKVTEMRKMIVIR